MKKIIFFLGLPLLSICCNISPPTKVKSERLLESVIGRVSVDKLPNFQLDKKKLLVQKDTLGYFFITNPPIEDKKLISAIQNTELFQYYPNGRLEVPVKFCSAIQNKNGLKIVFQGSPNPLFNEVLSLVFVDSFVVAQHIIPRYKYKDRGTVYNCNIITDSLRLTLNKYPFQKGDKIRGYLAYKGWKECSIFEENNRIVGEKVNLFGYFECDVE
jgi:hypothetical protein